MSFTFQDLTLQTEWTEVPETATGSVAKFLTNMGSGEIWGVFCYAKNMTPVARATMPVALKLEDGKLYYKSTVSASYKFTYFIVKYTKT